MKPITPKIPEDLEKWEQNVFHFTTPISRENPTITVTTGTGWGQICEGLITERLWDIEEENKLHINTLEMRLLVFVFIAKTVQRHYRVSCAAYGR